MANGADLDQHLDLLGILSVVMGALTVGMAGFGFLLATFATSLFAPWGDMPMFAGALTGFFALLLLAGVAAGIVGIVGGLDLRARRERGRVLVMILAALSLLSFPVGTAFGVYAFWVLTRPGVDRTLVQSSTATP